jgi:hypothetical protein
MERVRVAMWREWREAAALRKRGAAVCGESWKMYEENMGSSCSERVESNYAVDEESSYVKRRGTAV